MSPSVMILISKEKFDIMMQMLDNIAKPDYPDAKKRSHAESMKTVLKRESTDC